MDARTEQISTLLFDWDGTLVDSAQIGLAAFERSFAELGVVFDRDAYEVAYSPNWYSVYRALGLPEEKWQQADELWVRHYGDQTAEMVDGALETLLKLKEQGYQLGVVSSGSDCRVRREMSELKVDALFEAVVCNEQMENKKPHPEGLHTAIQSLNCSAMATCYVGDSPEDIEMGKRAGLLTIGVRSAYPTSWKLEKASPDIYIESICDLPSFFDPQHDQKAKSQTTAG